MPAMSTAVATAPTRRTCGGSSGRNLPVTICRAPKARMTPLAARSCRNSLSVSGMTPMSSRQIPSVATRTGVTRMARASSTFPWAAARASRTWADTPVEAVTAPQAITPALKVNPDASANIPRRLKCRCHHSGSDVVSAAAPVMRQSTTAARRIPGAGSRVSARREKVRTLSAGTAVCVRVGIGSPSSEIPHPLPHAADASPQCDFLCCRVVPDRRVVVHTSYENSWPPILSPIWWTS